MIGKETCRGCGTVSKVVEMGGIYFCPNKFCLSSGAWGKRLEAGYQDEKGKVSDEQLQKVLDDLEKEIKILTHCRRRWKKYAKEK